MKTRRIPLQNRAPRLAALLAAGMLSLTLAGPNHKSSSGSSSSNRKKKASSLATPPEVYSATEEDDGTPHARTIEPKAAQAGKPALATKKPPTENADYPKPLSESPRVVESQVIPKSEFEEIPERHVESIAGRLKLVERIIRDYGRAYDYRTKTTRELERILSELEHRNAPAAVETTPVSPTEEAKESDTEETAPLPTLYGQKD